MSRWVLSLLAVTLAAGLLGAAPPGTPEIVIRGWGRVIDPDGDCQISAIGPKVKLTVPGTAHDFAGELRRWNAPRVIRPVHGDFIAEVKISGVFDPKAPAVIEGRKPYNGAGLLLIVDNQTHASLQRAAFRDGDHVRHYLNFELRVRGELIAEHFDMDINDADCWLRLERRTGRIYAMISPNGVDWKSYEPIAADLPETLTIGIEAVNSAQSPFECGFERFSLFQVAPRDAGE